MTFSWIISYWPLLLAGAGQTLSLLVISVFFGFGRDIAAYRPLFSPPLAYQQADGRVIDHSQLM